MSNMSRLAQGIEEACSMCYDLKCEGCKIVADIGDKIVTVNGKTHDILSVKLKEEVKKGRVLSFCEKYSKVLLSFSNLARLLKRASIACIVLLICATSALADVINVEKLADAIYRAENSKSHPYGILQHYKHTTPRQACINTIKSNLKRFNKQTKEKDFIVFLGKTYCPTQGKYLTNNEKRLNIYWINNVKYFYNLR